MAKRIIIITVIVLLLVNTAVLALLWWDKKPAFHQPPGGNAKEFIKKELALTPQQVQQYDEMREIHFSKMQELNKSTRELKEQLFEQISTTDTSNQELNNLLQQIGNNEMQKDRITVEHFRHVRSILTEEQKEKFDKIIKDVMRMFGRPQPPGFRRGPRPPGAPGGDGPPGDHPPPPGEEPEPPR
jgi:periplasmic protein CpxP/Spy